MRNNFPKQRVSSFCYRGADTRRHVLTRLRRLQLRSGKHSQPYRISHKTLFQNASALAVADELRAIRDAGNLFSAGELARLARQGKLELTSEVLRLFTKTIVVTEVEDIALNAIPAFSLTLAPKNNMTVIIAEMWIKRASVVVGGFIEVAEGGASAIEEIQHLLGVVGCSRNSKA